jgi:hypothetical protein
MRDQFATGVFIDLGGYVRGVIGRNICIAIIVGLCSSDAVGKRVASDAAKKGARSGILGRFNHFHGLLSAGFFALVFCQHVLSQSNLLGGGFDELVFLDVFQGLLQAHFAGGF